LKIVLYTVLPGAWRTCFQQGVLLWISYLEDNLFCVQDSVKKFEVHIEFESTPDGQSDESDIKSKRLLCISGELAKGFESRNLRCDCCEEVV